MLRVFGIMARSLCAGLGAWVLSGAPAWAASPQSAPPVFVSENHALTLRSPTGAMICRLPPDWVGSDHGTVFFLSSPGDCGGVGFPSSSRSFSINAPRIEVYYGFLDEDESLPKCRRVVGSIKLAGKTRPVCRSKRSGLVEISASARYAGDGPSEVNVYLLTEPGRLAMDMPLLKALIASIEPCRVSWSNSDGKSGAYGSGKPCPKDGEFF